MTVSLAEKRRIGEGAHRTVRITDDRRICANSIKGFRVKNYGPLRVCIPMQLYTLLKYGVRDLNRQEEKHYRELIQRVPEELQCYFARIISCSDGELTQELIMDDSGEISKNLEAADDIPHEFWQCLRVLTGFLLDQDVFLFDIRHNVLVRRTGGTASNLDYTSCVFAEWNTEIVCPDINVDPIIANFDLEVLMRSTVYNRPSGSDIFRLKKFTLNE